MTVEYCKFNHVLISITAAILDVESLLEQIDTTPGTHYRAICITNALLGLSQFIRATEVVLFHLAGATVHLHCFPRSMPTLLLFGII